MLATEVFSGPVGCLGGCILGWRTGVGPLIAAAVRTHCNDTLEVGLCSRGMGSVKKGGLLRGSGRRLYHFAPQPRAGGGGGEATGGHAVSQTSFSPD